MKFNTARSLLQKNIDKMSLEQIQRYRASLISAMYESSAQYGMEQAVENGFYIILEDRGFVPKDIWLYKNICNRLDEVLEYEQKLYNK